MYLGLDFVYKELKCLLNTSINLFYFLLIIKKMIIPPPTHVYFQKMTSYLHFSGYNATDVANVLNIYIGFDFAFERDIAFS